jgi:hypothetical protein
MTPSGMTRTSEWISSEKIGFSEVIFEPCKNQEGRDQVVGSRTGAMLCRFGLAVALRFL